VVISFNSAVRGLQQSTKEKTLESLREIFYEASTKKSFQSEKEKESFYQTWLGVYLENYPDYTFLALDEGANKAIGYITCCPDTSADLSQLNQPSLSHWSEFYQDYPAHLHINCAASARGKGIGSKLCQALEDKLRADRIGGLHLVTAQGDRNTSFYKKLGFSSLKTHRLNENLTFLLLGKKILD